MTAPQPTELTDAEIDKLAKLLLSVSRLDGYSLHGAREFARAVLAAQRSKT